MFSALFFYTRKVGKKKFLFKTLLPLSLSFPGTLEFVLLETVSCKNVEANREKLRVSLIVMQIQFDVFFSASTLAFVFEL